MFIYLKSAKKKGKLSKAERERLQKEEEERKQKEEEEARLIAEQEEAERSERERKVQEEQERLESKDRERREDELAELRRTLEENHCAVNKWRADLRAKEKWDRYMKCDGSPDPSVPQEINTYINLWRENTDVEINCVLNQCALAINLIEELDYLLNETPSSELNEKEVLQYKESILNLQNLIYSKYNEATEEILKHSRDLADIETGNMRIVMTTVNVTLCLWANLSKNPRFRGLEFQDAGVAFELPKQLAVSDIAIRILHTHYDHLSHLSRSLQPLARRALAGTGAASPAGGRVEEQDQGQTEAAHIPEDETRSVKSDDRKSALSTTSAKEESSSVEKKTDEDGESKPESHSEETVIDAQEETTGAPQEHEEDILEEDAVDLHQFTPLGGVYYYDVFRLPPQSKDIKGWTITELSETGLQPFPYPLEQNLPQTSGSAKSEERERESDNLTSPPVGVTISLPDSVTFLEDPQVARWDGTGHQWKTDRISDVKYDKEAKKIYFKMDTFYIFTLMQDSYVNMPFQFWELRPLGLNTALFTVTAAISEVEITIKDDKCMLNITASDSSLSQIRGKWMTPSALIRAMRSAGVNIFVDEYSDRYVSVNEKDPQLEQAAYDQMALVSSAYAFCWSQWNAEQGKEHLVMQVSEHLKTDPVSEEEWSLYLLSTQKAMRLKNREYYESFSTELAEGSEFHSTFLHMLKERMCDAALDRINRSHYLFIDCVQKLLYATRVLTYS
uniref:Dynein axonemal intermediate chain 7 n=1 Tax=Lepisosteus oculatus TaxID=7918 RepID=W5NE13_LEPOC